MKNQTKKHFHSILLALIFILTIQSTFSQQVEVQGELKVTDMTANDTQENLVIRNSDGTLGTRSVASLPAPPSPIDTTRNLASDFELAKHLCDCPNLPPFMIKKLLESGYSEEDLIGSGIPIHDVLDAQRSGLMIDPRDNQAYKTVTIGTQTWMAENLNYGNQIDGSVNQMDNPIIEKYCYDDNANNCATYGGLYQWNEMMQYITTEGTQGICPTGWHLPTDDEWKTLEMELGMIQVEADDTGSRGTDQGSQLSYNESLWTNGSLDQNGAFGSSGFAILPGGVREGTFNGLLSNADFWTSTQDNGTLAYDRYFFNTATTVDRFNNPKTWACSVRCIQD